MRIERFSHNLGEIVIESDISQGVIDTLVGSTFHIKEGCANRLRNDILTELKLKGWSDDFMLDVNSQISLTSSIRDSVLCFQTGNMSRFYADLLKLQYVFNSGKAKSAIYIIPSKDAAKKIGSNIANFDRFCFELQLFKDIITIPTLVIGIN